MKPTPQPVKYNKEESFGYRNNIYQAEAYRSRPCFGLINQEYEQIVGLSTCKSYVHDQIARCLKGEFFYGGPVKMDEERTRILVSDYRGDAFMARVENLLDFLHQIEKKLGFKRTYVEIPVNMPNPPNQIVVPRVNGVYGPLQPYLMHPDARIVIFVGSKRWQASAPMVSLYMTLIRTCLSHVKGTPWRETLQQIADEKLAIDYGTDATYIKGSLEVIDRLVEKGVRYYWDGELKENWADYAGHGDGIFHFASSPKRQTIEQKHGNLTTV